MVILLAGVASTHGGVGSVLCANVWIWLDKSEAKVQTRQPREASFHRKGPLYYASSGGQAGRGTSRIFHLAKKEKLQPREEMQPVQVTQLILGWPGLCLLNSATSALNRMLSGDTHAASSSLPL